MDNSHRHFVQPCWISYLPVSLTGSWESVTWNVCYTSGGLNLILYVCHAQLIRCPSILHNYCSQEYLFYKSLSLLRWKRGRSQTRFRRCCHLVELCYSVRKTIMSTLRPQEVCVAVALWIFLFLRTTASLLPPTCKHTFSRYWAFPLGVLHNFHFHTAISFKDLRLPLAIIVAHSGTNSLEIGREERRKWPPFEH